MGGMQVRLPLALCVAMMIHGVGRAEDSQARQMSAAAHSLDTGDYDRAEELLRRLAESEVSAAETLLGTIAANGRKGHPPQPAIAAAWFIRAANRGYPPAQLALASAFASGSGVARDEKRALALARSAARAGTPGASQLALELSGNRRLAMVRQGR